MSPTMRIVMGVLAGLAAIGLMGVSITANMKFAMSWAKDPAHQNILALASAAADVFKGCALAFFLYLVARKAWASATAIAILGSIATLFSLVSATGFVAGDRYQHFYEAVAARNNTKEDREILKDQEAKRGWMPVARPISVIEAEIATLHLDPSWKTTAGCTRSITIGRREDLCRRYGRLQVEMASAKAAAMADKRIAAAREEIREHGRDYGDPLVETIRAFIGIDERTILLWLIVLAVLLIEVGSALGPTVALAMLAPDRLNPVKGFIRPRVPVPATARATEADVEIKAMPAPPSYVPPAGKQPATVAQTPASEVRVPAIDADDPTARLKPLRRAKAAASFKSPAAIKPEVSGHVVMTPVKLHPVQRPKRVA